MLNTEILQLIKKTSSTNDKIFLAVNNFKELEHQFMIESFNNIIYGISETNINKAIGYDSFIHGRFEDIGEYLEKNPISDCQETKYNIREFIALIIAFTGNDQIDKLKSILISSISKEDAPWYIRVLLKNPRIGISETSYNKIRLKQGLKPLDKFYCKLAELLEPENFNKVVYPIYSEIKYDGERADIIYDNDDVHITSRNGNDITSQFPEIVEEIKNYMKGQGIKYIRLDGEIISKSFNSLQKRMGRLEKNINIDYDITFICFDVLQINDDNYVDKPQFERRAILESLSERFKLKLSDVKICNNIQDVNDFYYKAINNKEEGIILKEMSAKLAIKKDDRENWYKVKPTYTSDLEIIGAEYGKGKNKDYINILTIKDYTGIIKSNVSSGMTDELRKLCTNLHNKKELIGTIVEVKYNIITETNSLRHPRIIKLRFDKDIADKLQY